MMNKVLIYTAEELSVLTRKTLNQQSRLNSIFDCMYERASAGDFEATVRVPREDYDKLIKLLKDGKFTIKGRPELCDDAAIYITISWEDEQK